jgi:energy-coupling factor transport system permease protein
MRAATAGVLDRALDVAAVLEVRGYGASGRYRRRHRPRNRHDVGFITASVAILALALAAGPFGLASFSAYPGLAVTAGPTVLGLALALVAAALLPFADRRGIGR